MNPEENTPKMSRPDRSNASWNLTENVLVGSGPKKEKCNWDEPDEIVSTQAQGGSSFLVWWILGFIILLAGASFYLLNGKPKQPIAAKITALQIGEEKWVGLLPEAVAQRFIDATTIEERLVWVRDPDETEPLLREFFENGAGAQEKIIALTHLGGGKNEQSFFHRFKVSLEDGGKRLLCVSVIENRAFVDFKCYARYGSATWQELLSGQKSEAQEVRVFVELDSFYMGAFSDESRWLSLTTTTPDCEDALYFYVDRNSVMGNKIAQLSEGEQQRMTLGIRSVNNSHEKKQFEVIHLHAFGWSY